MEALINKRVLAESIPKELTLHSQWVVWKAEEKPSIGYTKVPYQPNGKKAKTNDPRTWTDFKTAIETYKNHGFDGIRFVLTAKQPLCGIDLDACRDPDTGQLKPWAEKIVQQLNSYTEVTPSAMGLRVLVKAILPPTGRKRGPIEMYDQARYLTVTGHRLPLTPTTIEYRQLEIQALHQRIFHRETRQSPTAVVKRALNLTDMQLIDKACLAKNGPRFSKLWQGDYSGYPSRSEADLALCSYLAFWTTRDPGRIDRLFRQSGLFRDKWDEKHSVEGKTYGEATIEKVVNIDL